MAFIGYGRVSRRDQHPEAQRDALARVGCEQIFVDKLSGKLERRPELDTAILVLRPGDTFVITKLDRLARSAKQLHEIALEVLKARGVHFRVLDQGIDTSTPAGRLFFRIVAAYAEFEHDMIVERTLDGLEAARARGRVGGRPTKMTPTRTAQARLMYEAKGEDGRRMHTVQEIADTFGVSRPAVYRALDRIDITQGM